MPNDLPSFATSTMRILDANFNRASEGLRVVEEFARFHLNDRFLSSELKLLRHRAMQAMQALLPSEALLAGRETLSDVGTQTGTGTEYQRESLLAVVRANMQRVQQALRSLEEYGKTAGGTFAQEIEALRYRSYTLEKALVSTASSQRTFANRQLYVLLDGRGTHDDFRRWAQLLVATKVAVVQLRDKGLWDRELLARAITLREVTRDSETLMVVNDRPDIAVLASSDALHLGQDELTLRDARRIVGTKMLIGLSTHSLDQARRAVLEGADYIGCGPTFPSYTKSFAEFPGLPLLEQVIAEISLPTFAIGGIALENVAAVCQTGCTRIAVSNAVLAAKDPAAAIEQLQIALQANHAVVGPRGIDPRNN